MTAELDDTDAKPPYADDGALEPILALGRNCWRIEMCDRAAAIVDAADYYHVAREAMLAARQRILVIGWDFDTRIPLEPEEKRGGDSLGRFFLELAQRTPRLQIDILKWSFGAKKQFLRPSTAWMLWKWQRSPGIDFRFDSAHPAGCSHHQKIVVIDETLAVCGGIDMSTARWDTPEHRDDDPRRILPNGKPYTPWHDVTMMMEGPVAVALGDLGVDRWRTATRSDLPPIADEPAASAETLWPEDLDAPFKDVAIGIARTRAEYKTAKCQVDEVREIEALYLDMIAAARRFIYIENQYFTSGKIAAAISERLAEADPPEVVMIMPRTADGWLEQKAMDAARVKLARAIAKVDPQNRFRIYVPVTCKGGDIYVHAKISIVDDRLLRIGSSNLNNRSLGLHSECDVVIDAALPQNRNTPEAIAALRTRLIAEHLAVEPAVFAAAFEKHGGSLVDAIEALRGQGKTLDLLDLVKPGPFDNFIAENELLDPESADALLDPIGERGLRKHWRQGLRWSRKRRARRKARREERRHAR